MKGAGPMGVAVINDVVVHRSDPVPFGCDALVKLVWPLYHSTRNKGLFCAPRQNCGI
jgi:hypothetical protein